ncbi:MAG: thiamine biosynthesis protein ThiS [Omnitrophica bacterium RIFOXYB12_FULL_50_7]|nr:MAG: thiamine biosynthesis protein ThiS [Omnitrophica bacterium RIFOXYB12_FULL_50_7]
MNIKVNGKTETIKEKSLAIAGLLKFSKVENPEMVSVQRNGAFVNKENFDTTYLEDGDEIDFIYFMGGGAHQRTVMKGEGL